MKGKSDNEGGFNMVEEALKAADNRKMENMNVQKNERENLRSFF